MNEIASFADWVSSLKQRYRTTQIKAAISVNSALLRFYWELGRDVCEKYAAEEKRYGAKFFQNLSDELTREIPEGKGFSPRNLAYCKGFFALYSRVVNLRQVVAKSPSEQTEDILPDVAPSSPHVGIKCGPTLPDMIFTIPWGHHCNLIDKCKGDAEKALFYVRKTISQGWSRSVLLNMIGTNLYEREGRAQTNFNHTMIPQDSDLARSSIGCFRLRTTSHPAAKNRKRNANYCGT